MPDYNRKATAGWWSVVVLGLAALAVSAQRVAGLPWQALVQLAGRTAPAMLIAIYLLKLLRAKQVLALRDVFIFLL